MELWVYVHTQSSDLRAASNNWQLTQEELLLSYLPSKQRSRPSAAALLLTSAWLSINIQQAGFMMLRRVVAVVTFPLHPQSLWNES